MCAHHWSTGHPQQETVCPPLVYWSPTARNSVPTIGLLVTHSKKQQQVLTAFRLHYKGISVLFFSCGVLSNYDSKALLFTVMTHIVSSLATKLQPILTGYTRAAVIRRKQRVLNKENRKTHLTCILTLIENKHA
jgi:hypothetical protein